MKVFAILTIFANLVAASPLIFEENKARDAGHEMEFGDFSYGGIGCPQGSIGHTLSADGSLLNLKYDSLMAYADKDVPIPNRRSFCQLNLEVFVPHGFQFSIMQTDYRGYAFLDAGLRGYHKATYYFSGSTNQLSRTKNFYGPMDEDYLITDEHIVASAVWSPCGTTAMLNLKQEIGIKPFGGDKMGLMDVASSDHKLEQIVHFAFRECTE